MPTLRGASADALAALEKSLSGTGAKSAGAVAESLVAAAATMRGEGALRRYVTDAAVPVEARTGLATELFGKTIDKSAMDLLADAVSRRWTRAGDLPIALEHLAVVARVLSAGTSSGRLSDELFAVAQAVKATPELRDALSDPARSVGDKAALVDDLIGTKALGSTVALVKQALDGTHRTVTAALEDFQKVAADVHGQGVATVRVAHELSDTDRTRLAAALERQYARPVHLNVVIDPDVMGGIRVEIGDDIIDGTVSSRLAEARRRLAG